MVIIGFGYSYIRRGYGRAEHSAPRLSFKSHQTLDNNFKKFYDNHVHRNFGGIEVAKVPEVKIVEAAKGLILLAGLAVNVVQADIQTAAAKLAREYGVSSSREIEAEIARHLRNRG